MKKQFFRVKQLADQTFLGYVYSIMFLIVAKNVNLTAPIMHFYLHVNDNFSLLILIIQQAVYFLCPVEFLLKLESLLHPIYKQITSCVHLNSIMIKWTIQSQQTKL